MVTLEFTPATLEDLDIINDLEARSYAPDEAASPENIRKRIQYAQATKHAELLFMVARDNDSRKIVGFLCCTLADSSLVTEASMEEHQPSGNTVCLHSVCVSPDARRQGIATLMLRHWIQCHHTLKVYQRIAILSRPHLVPFYSSVGFKELGISNVVHGPDPWVDCVIDL